MKKKLNQDDSLAYDNISLARYLEITGEGSEATRTDGVSMNNNNKYNYKCTKSNSEPILPIFQDSYLVPMRLSNNIKRIGEMVVFLLN